MREFQTVSGQWWCGSCFHSQPTEQLAHLCCTVAPVGGDQEAFTLEEIDEEP